MLGEALRVILERYGQPVALWSPGGEELGRGKAFFQPILERAEQKVQSLPTPLGERRQDRFLCLAEPGLPMEEAREGWLTCRGTAYEFQTLQAIYEGERRCHWWGVLRTRDREEGEDRGEHEP